MAGVVVKSMGKNIEINAMRTVFSAKTLKNDTVIYKSKNLTPEQEALLSGTNFHPYQPARREGVVSTGSKSADTSLSSTGADKSSDRGSRQQFKVSKKHGKLEAWAGNYSTN